MTPTPPPKTGLERYDRFLLGAVAVLAVATVIVLLAPVRLFVVAPALDHTLDDIALLATVAITAQAWFRYLERHDAIAFYQTVAFLILSLANLAAAVTSVWSQPGPAGVVGGQGELYVWSVARLVAAVLLSIGGGIALSGRRPLFPWLAAGGSILAVLVIGAVVLAGVPLPPLVEGTGDQLRNTFLGTAIPLTSASLFGVGAVVSWRLWKGHRIVADAYITLSLILASFAQLHAAVFPGTHPGPVSSADFLRLGFYIVLLLAIQAEAAQLLRSLRRSNRALEDLRQSEVDRAALEERARLSRELHDGLAQALWLAKLRVVRLLSLPELADSARELAVETADAVELGLSEARQAVLSMNLSARSDASFESLLERYVHDFADRFGIRVTFEVSGSLPQLPARTQAELLRIAIEALTNVKRHAAAAHANVLVHAEDGEINLVVTDDGRGFDIDQDGDSSFGLGSMRERAALIGGRLAIESTPGAGTRIGVTAPIRFPVALVGAS